MLFDTHGRPLPAFYDLTIERRAEAIAVERCAWHATRVRKGRAQFFYDCARLVDDDLDSVARLDILSTKKSNALYQRILLGDLT